MKKIIFILLAFLLVYSPVKADAVEELTYKWQAIQPETTKTDDSILVDWEYLGKQIDENKKSYYLFTLTYTIPEDYDKETLVINPDIFEVIAWGQYEKQAPYILPGYTLKVNVKIINKSKYNYNYDEDSFVIYPYSSKELEEIGYQKISDTKTFNDEAITELQKFRRTSNLALKALTTKTKDMNNDTLDTLLKEKGYSGISDLATYYLDFFNDYYNYGKDGKEKITKLTDFTKEEIAYGIFGGNAINYEEDNPELIKLHYDFLFNYAMGISLADENIDDTNQHEYTPGEYMRNISKGDDKIQEHIGNLSNNTEQGIDMNFHFNGPLLTNAYQGYRITGHAHLSYTAEQGKVIAKYIDTAGNVLADEVITTGMVNKEYQTTDKIIDNYNLVKVEGEEIGTYTKEDIIVTYIYSLIDKNIPDTGVKTNNNLEIAAASSLIILIGALFLKKKFN